jgi:serine/threonine protein kinase
LSSHNIFIALKKIGVGTFEISVRISDIENINFMEYGNMFYNYRISSVWSAPEVLKYPKKIQELTTKMDVYSFGMILWELWHE